MTTPLDGLRRLLARSFHRWPRPRVATTLLAAVHFLTRVPTPATWPVTADDIGRSQALFPLVGLLLGAMLVALDAGLSALLARPIVDGLLLLVAIAVTGALHLDGFVDSCDGLFSFTSPERRLEIMRDSHVGAFGAVGACLLLLVKWAALVAVPAPLKPAALLLMPTLARWSIVYNYAMYPYARPEPGLSRTIKEHAVPSRLALATGIAVAASVAVLGPPGLLLTVGAWTLVVALAAYVLRKLPGLTGDTYGFVAELVEVLVLLGVPLVQGGYRAGGVA